MTTHDIELPPLPPLHIAPSVEPVDYPKVAQALMDYARAAIEPYAKRIAQLKADRKRRGEPVAWIQRTCLNLIRESNVALHNVVVRGSILDGDGDVVPLFTAPQPAEPVKSHLKVSYDDKGDCLYVVCDSNEPADAEEDDKGILYRRAISDGRLVGITIMNFMGPHAESRYGKGTP